MAEKTTTTAVALTVEQSLQVDARIKAARAEERARLKGILEHAEAKERQRLAMAMALESDTSAYQVIKMLAAAPKEAAVRGPNQFAAMMARIENPRVGADADDDIQRTKQGFSRGDIERIYAGWNQPKGRTA